MEKGKNYIVEDEDGVVLYDETDDQEFVDDEDVMEEETPASTKQSDSEVSPAEEEDFVLTDVEEIPMGGIIKDKDGYRLITNEEIFTDEHMQTFDRYITDKKARKKSEDMMVSIGVIVFCLALIMFFVWLFS